MAMDNEPTNGTPAGSEGRPQPAGSRCCGNVDLSNLGRCMRCVVLAAFLTLLAWTGFVLVRRHLPLPWLSAALFGFASLFTLLLLAHAGAFLAREPSR
jgi:hypothetical protein